MSGEKLMGRQAAGYSYVKGVASLGFDTISFYTKNLIDREKVTKLIQPLTKKTDIHWVSWDEPHKSEEFGGIFFQNQKLVFNLYLDPNLDINHIVWWAYSYYRF